MRINRFFFKIIFILLAVILLNVITRLIVNESFWGNQELYVKNYLFEKNKKYNSAFIGSSLTRRHIIPEIIDSICDTKKLSLYNLGAPQTLPPETFYLCKYLLENRNQLKTIFIELVPFEFNTKIKNNIFTRNYYFFNLKTIFLFHLDNYFQSNKLQNLKYATENIIVSIKYALYNLCNVDFLSTISIYSSKTNFEKLLKPKQNAKTESGFFAFSDNEEADINLDDNTLNKKIADYIKVFRNNDVVINFSQLQFLKEVEDLNNLGKQRNIDIIWVLPPCLSYRALIFILPIFNRIDADKRINMADPNKYHLFYEKALHHNQLHLNHEGAIKYSTALANEFNAL